MEDNLKKLFFPEQDAKRLHQLYGGSTLGATLG